MKINTSFLMMVMIVILMALFTTNLCIHYLGYKEYEVPNKIQDCKGKLILGRTADYQYWTCILEEK